MSQLLNILAIFITIIIIYYILTWLFGSSTAHMTKTMSGKKTKTIAASSMPANNNSGNFTYSLWFYVNDWNYRFGEEKVVLTRLNSDNKDAPTISFDTMENNILVTLSTYPSSGSSTDASVSYTKTYTVKNFQLQKWVNLIVSVYGRTLDVYLDGKLVRTFVLPGIPKVSTKTNVQITPNGGFDGSTSSIKYWPNAKNPQEAYNIYRNGHGGSILGNLFNKYRIKVAFVEDNIEKSSLEI